MNNNRSSTAGSAGIGMGAVLAALISWEETHSLLWTIFHLIGGWIYVIYSLIIGRVHF
ncbi:MAG: hypothetical protein ACYC27_18315 [Armatimonadota bacterium]